MCRELDTEVLAIYKEADGTNFWNHRLKRENFPSLSMFPGLTGKTSFAHIAPNDPVCAVTWGEAAALITGKKANNMLESEELRDFVRGTTGVENPFKMWAWNYLQLPIDHAAYFDDVKEGKALIIAPIWNPEKAWKPGTPYRLLVASTAEGYKWLMGVQPMKQNAPQQHWFGVASDTEYSEATDFLQMTVKALAESLDNSELVKFVAETMEQANKEPKNDEGEGQKKKKNGSLDLVLSTALNEKYGNIEEMVGQAYFDENASKATNPSNSSQHLLAELTAKLQSLANTKNAMKKIGEKAKMGSSMVYTPGRVENMPANILTIDLGEYFEGKQDMIPDPYWLALKAAVNYSKYRGTVAKLRQRKWRKPLHCQMK